MKWVFVDGNNIVHRAARALYSRSGVVDANLTVHSVLDAFLHIGMDERVLSNRFAVFFDSNKSKRKEMFPQYKANRSRDLDRCYARGIRQVFERLRDVLKRCGFPTYELLGYEADDLIAQAAKFVDSPAIIISSDADLWQCISDTVHWYDYGRKKYYDRAGFITEYGDPVFYANVLAIAGCSSDGIPGVGGVGEVTAWKYLRGEDISMARKNAIKANADVVHRNWALVRLPLKGIPTFVLNEPVYDLGFCEKMVRDFPGVNLNSWANFCRGRMSILTTMLSRARRARRLEHAKRQS